VLQVLTSQVSVLDLSSLDLSKNQFSTHVDPKHLENKLINSFMTKKKKKKPSHQNPESIRNKTNLTEYVFLGNFKVRKT